MIRYQIPQRPQKSSRTPWLGVLILLLGAVLRLAAFDETLILGDQSAILDAAFQTAHLRYFPMIGMKSSAGVMQTGIVPLLASIPLFFIKRIIAVQWFFSVLDVLALAWLYRAVRKTLGNHTATIAALLYATAPWVILYARTIWFQTLIATFATLTFGSILLLLAKTKPGVLVLAMVSTTMMSMVHLAAAPWGVLLFVFYVIIARRQRQWRAFWWGIGISSALVLPYLIYSVRSSFKDIVFILEAGAGKQGLNTTAYRLSRELISGSMIIANAHGDLWDRSVIMWHSASSIILVILGVSFFWACYRIITNWRLRPHLLFTIVWMLVVPALYIRSDVHLQHFYLMMIFPSPFILIAAWVEDCLFWRGSAFASRFWKVIGSIAVGFLICIAVWWSSLWIVRIKLEARGLLERPTRGWLMDRTAEVIAHYLEMQPDSEIIVLADFTGEMSMFEWLRGYVQTDNTRVVASGQGLLIPEGSLCYMLGPQVPVQTLSPVLDGLSEQPEMTIPATPPWRFFCGIAPAEKAAPLAQWVNGLKLLKTEITGEFQPGAQLDIVHTWVYASTGTGAYHFYNHLLKDGTLVAQVDGRSVPYWYWRDGDTLLTYFKLSLPDELSEGNYVLRTGMYTWPGLERVLRETSEDGYDVFEVTVPVP